MNVLSCLLLTWFNILKHPEDSEWELEVTLSSLLFIASCSFRWKFSAMRSFLACEAAHSTFKFLELSEKPLLIRTGFLPLNIRNSLVFKTVF